MSARLCVSVGGDAPWGFSPSSWFELLKVLRAKTIMSRKVYEGPGAALRRECGTEWRYALQIGGGRGERCGEDGGTTQQTTNFYSPGRFLLCMEHYCQWWRSGCAWTSLTVAVKHQRDIIIIIIVIILLARQTARDWQRWRLMTFQQIQLTLLKRRVFPESHSPTSSTALLTVLLVRKYFRNTEEINEQTG